MKEFDWEKCREFVAEREPVEVTAGLLEDFYWTAGTVYQSGEWIDDHCAHLRSMWATPGFMAEMPNGDMIEVEAVRRSGAMKESTDAE